MDYYLAVKSNSVEILLFLKAWVASHIWHVYFLPISLPGPGSGHLQTTHCKTGRGTLLLTWDLVVTLSEAVDTGTVSHTWSTQDQNLVATLSTCLHLILPISSSSASRQDCDQTASWDGSESSIVVVFQLLSDAQCFVTPWTVTYQASLSFTISWSLLRFMSIELMMLSNHLNFFHPCPLLPSIFPSISVFSSEWALCIRCPKYWSFSFSISPSNEYSGLISLDWLVWSPCSPRESQESSPVQFRGMNSSVLSLLYSPALTSAHDYWKKNIVLTIWTFVSKMVSVF